ncbi:MAG: sigma-70 family RNA polymerase sigma factor [Saprospiraceae bacterium]|nr:sigma-70 family RNA polymerase sigma factor [Saprospiraceae bacterium]
MTLNPNIQSEGVFSLLRKKTYMTERDLIIGCQQGEASAERLLVDRFAPMLLTVARRYVPDEPTAEDVLQEAYIRIFNAIKSYDPDRGALEAWMRKIVINSALQRFRKRAYKYEVPGLEQVVEPELNPDVFSHLGAEELLKLIAALPDLYRLVFNLYVIEGYEHSEIGKMLNIATASSRSRLQRARKMLQEQILELENRSYEPR